MHWAANWAHDYYHNTWGLDGPDNEHEKIRILMNEGRFGSEFTPKAGVPQLMFRNIDGINLASLDIVGHEYTHWVIYRSSDLVNFGLAGALAESFADIFGTAVERFAKAGSYDWEVAKEVTGTGKGIRDMDEGDASTGFPEQSQIVDDDEFMDPEDLTENNGGIHVNCGIPNKVYQRLVDGATACPAIGWDKAILIWIRTMKNVQKTSTFLQARQVSLQVTKDLFGRCSDEYWSVQASWALSNVGPWPIRCASIGRVQGEMSPGGGGNSRGGGTMYAHDPLENDTIKLVAYTKDTTGILYAWDMPGVAFDTLDSSAHITYVPPGTGTYLFKVSIIGPGDTLQDSVYLHIIPEVDPICSTGIVNKANMSEFDEHEWIVAEEAVRVFPNPANHSFKVLGLKSNEEYNVRLMNLNGQEFLNKAMRKGDELKVDELPPGMYYFILSGIGLEHREKLIVH